MVRTIGLDLGTVFLDDGVASSSDVLFPYGGGLEGSGFDDRFVLDEGGAVEGSKSVGWRYYSSATCCGGVKSRRGLGIQRASSQMVGKLVREVKEARRVIE